MPFKKGHPSYWTEETKRKVSQRLKGHSGYWKNKRMSLSHKKNLSKSRIGHKVSNEQRKKLALATKEEKEQKNKK